MELSFADYIEKEIKREMKPYLEMAMYQGNNFKIPIVFDQDDTRFLQQFPPEYWEMALFWRYSEGLLQVAEAWEAHSGGKQAMAKKYRGTDKWGNLTDTPEVRDFPYPEVQDVEIKRWADPNTSVEVYTFPKIRTGMKELWIKLQKRIDPKWLRDNPPSTWPDKYPEQFGFYDYDLTEPMRGVYVPDDADEMPEDKTIGQQQDIRDPTNIFNRSFKTTQYESIRRNLRAWAKINELELAAGNVPDEWEGPDGKKYPVVWLEGVQLSGGQGKVVLKNYDPKKARAHGRSTKFRLPCIKVQLEGYQVESLKDGKTKAIPSLEYYIPILLPGVIFAKWNPEKEEFELPIETSKEEFIKKQLGELNKNTFKLKDTPLVDSSAKVAIQPIPPQTNEDSVQWSPRTTDNLKKFIRACREQLRLSDEWIRLLDGMIDFAATDKGKQNVSVMNLCRMTNPRQFSDFKKDSQEKYPISATGRFSKPQQIWEFVRNISLLNDEDRAALAEHRISAAEVAAAYGTKAQASLQDMWVAGGINNSITDAMLGYEEEEDRIRKAMGDDEWDKIQREYAKMAWKAVESIKRNSSVPDQELLSIHEADLVDAAVATLMLMGANDRVGIPLKQGQFDAKAHAERNADRMSFLKTKIQNELQRLKRSQGAQTSMNAQAGGDEEGAEKGDFLSGDDQSGGISGALGQQSNVGRNRFWIRRGEGGGVGGNLAARRSQQGRALDRRQIEDRWSEVKTVFERLNSAHGEAEALRLLRKSLIDKAVIDPPFNLVSSDSEIAGIYRDVERVMREKAHAPDAGLASQYIPNEPMSDEEKSIQAETEESMELTADDGMVLSADGSEYDLKTIPPENKERALADLSDYYATNFVRKEIHDKYWPAIVRLTSSAHAQKPEREPAQAASPQGEPTQSPAQRQPTTSAVGMGPQVTAAKTLVDRLWGMLVDPNTRRQGMAKMRETDDEGRSTIMRVIMQNEPQLRAAYPEIGAVLDKIKNIAQTLKVKLEMSLPVGYPDKNDGEYNSGVKREIIRKGAQAWGTLGTPTGNSSYEGDPITKRAKGDTGGEGDGKPIQRWASLKEFLVNQDLKNRKALLKERVERKNANCI